jgi:tetratricopeptide (TPR) repeat protein
VRAGGSASADRRARRRLRIARYWHAAGDLDEAARHAERARALASRADLVGETTLAVAEIERDRGEYASSHARLVELVERLAESTLLGRVLTALGDAQRRSGRYRQAVETLHRAVRLLADADPDLLAAALTMLAITSKEAGDYAEAHRLYTRIRDMRPDASAGQLADLHHNLAGLAYAEERYDAAEEYARRAVRLRHRSGAGELGLAPDRAVLAAALAALHRYDEARDELNRALAACRASRPPRRYEIAVQLHNLAAVEQACGLLGRAEELYREALAYKEDLLGPDHPEIALLANNLGTLLQQQQRGTEAAYLFRRALAIAERGYPSGHPVIAGIRANLG